MSRIKASQPIVIQGYTTVRETQQLPLPFRVLEFVVMSYLDGHEPGLCFCDALLEVFPLSIAEDKLA